MGDLKHYGTPRRSGRYPWGSGKDPQRSRDFNSYVKDLKKQGLSDLDIAKGMGITTTLLREKRRIARIEKRAADAAFAQRLKDKGYSLTAIGKRMGGINESSVRSLLDPAIKERVSRAVGIQQILEDNVDQKRFIDVGEGAEYQLGVNRTVFDTGVALAKEHGYTVHTILSEQPQAPGHFTKFKVLAPPGTTLSEVSKNRSQIRLIDGQAIDDESLTFSQMEKPRSISGEKVKIRYKGEGGEDADGLIEIRRGVPELDIGAKRFAQVRISVDGTHYMKGMAIHVDEMPDGIDVIYNTSKTKDKGKYDVLKPNEKFDPLEPNNPFGSSVRQKYYIDKNGEKHLSALNMVGYKEGSGEEGSWEKWSKNLSSQVLSKQTPELARRQLDLAFKLKQEEFDEIMSISNPAVRRALLKPFGDSADADTVQLKAAALPGQATHVLLPFKSIKENEVYSQKYNNGDVVVLIRHPHGGIFEIPELRVNNKNKEARRIIGDSPDAVGINPKVAQKLSGADFDGDTVIVIPNKNRTIQTRPSLDALKDFDPKVAYPYHDGMVPMTKKGKQLHMGNISNLITDMTIKGASFDEIARAVKHSMVVIDAEKHKLNYRQSAIDNNIAELKRRYQGSKTSGAATLISLAGSEKRVPQREPGVYVLDPATGKKRKIYIDPVTGKKLYTPTGKTYFERRKLIDPITKEPIRDPVTGRIKYEKTGKVLPSLTKSTKISEEDDAFKLSSGTRMETIYARYANSLKDLANRARLEMIKIKDDRRSPSARNTYKVEVESLTSKLALALRNKPYERQAQLLANKMIAAKRKSNPDMDDDDLKKFKSQALELARTRTNAKKQQILFTDREWEAIQAGAISPHHLSRMLGNADLKALKERALPRVYRGMSPGKVSRAKDLQARGYTRKEIADSLGVSVETLSKVLNK